MKYNYHSFFGLLLIVVCVCSSTRVFSFVSKPLNETTPKKKSAIKFHTPEEFGAIGNGIHDDTQALTKALQSAYNISFTKAKKYRINNTLIIKNVTNKVIDLNTATIIRPSSKVGISFVNCINVILQNGHIVITSPVTKGHGFENCLNYVNCKNIASNNLSINGSDEMGIAYINCIGVTASGNVIQNCYRDGIHEIYCVNVKVFNNKLSNIKDDALSCHDYGTLAQKLFIVKNGYPQAANIKIYNNIINNCYQGITSIACKNITISSNDISATVGAGIAVFNTQAINIGGMARVNGASILNNKINNACANQKIMGANYANSGQNSTGRACIFVGTLGTNGQMGNDTHLSNIVIKGNTINNGGVNGLWFTNTDGAIFDSNTFTDCCIETSAFSGTVCAVYSLTNATISNNKTIDDRQVKKHYFGYDLQNITGTIVNLVDEGSKGGYHVINAPDFKH